MSTTTAQTELDHLIEVHVEMCAELPRIEDLVAVSGQPTGEAQVALDRWRVRRREDVG